MLVNAPASGPTDRCPDSPAQFVQPGSDHLDKFSPDASRCSYDLPASAQVVELRGEVRTFRADPGDELDLGRALPEVWIELREAASTQGPPGLRPGRRLTRARAGTDGQFFMTGRIRAQGLHALVVLDNTDRALVTQWIDLAPGQRDVPSVQLRVVLASSAREGESPSAERPAIERPATERPAAERPATERPASESAAAEGPAAERPAAPPIGPVPPDAEAR